MDSNPRRWPCQARSTRHSTTSPIPPGSRNKPCGTRTDFRPLPAPARPSRVRAPRTGRPSWRFGTLENAPRRWGNSSGRLIPSGSGTELPRVAPVGDRGRGGDGRRVRRGTRRTAVQPGGHANACGDLHHRRYPTSHHRTYGHPASTRHGYVDAGPNAHALANTHTVADAQRNPDAHRVRAPHVGGAPPVATRCDALLPGFRQLPRPCVVESGDRHGGGRSGVGRPAHKAARDQH